MRFSFPPCRPPPGNSVTTRTFSGPDEASLLSEIHDAVEAGFQPTLALVFCSVDWDIESLRVALASRGLAVVGATTAGEIAGAEILEGGCSVMLWEAAPDTFEVWVESRAEGEPMEAVAQRLGRAAVERFGAPAVLTFGSGLSTDGEAVVRGVAGGAGRSIPLYGGLAGDDMRMVQTRVFTHDTVSSDGLVGLILDGECYHLEGFAASGWKSVGIPKTVTRSAGNVVFELDGEAVLDVYSQYLGTGSLRGETVDIGMDIGVKYPLSVEREDGTSVIRAPMFFDPETNGLNFAGTVAEGSLVRFCIPPSLEIVDQVIEDAGLLRAQLPEADAVVLISCKARHTALGPIVEDEVEGLNDVWGAPMAGYFSYGEIGGPMDGRSDFHNETCTLLAVRAKTHA